MINKITCFIFNNGIIECKFQWYFTGKITLLNILIYFNWNKTIKLYTQRFIMFNKLIRKLLDLKLLIIVLWVIYSSFIMFLCSYPHIIR